MSNLEVLEAMDLVKEDFLDDRKGNASASCSMCLDLVIDQGERSIAKLQCGHEFHLDCIGSAFNAKGAMQCPNCRRVEKGRWLYASGHRSSSVFDFDVWGTENFYDLSYSELPFGFQWCPFQGITQLASLIEEGESQLNSYHHESTGNTTYGDHNNVSISTHACSYLALHGHPYAMQFTPSSSSSDSVPENNTFPRHPTNFGGGQPSAAMINSHSFTNSNPRNHNRQQHSIPFSFLGNVTDQSTSQFDPRLSRSDASSQQRLRSFVHPHSHHGSGARGGSNVAALIGPLVMGEMRNHSYTHTSRRHGNNHIHQQSVPSSLFMSTPFPPIRRSRPRAFIPISSLSSTSSSAEIGRFYGLASISSSANRFIHHQDAESMAHNFDQFYGWGSREGLTPLPWISQEGESQWWGPFNTSQASQSGGSFVPRANITSERAGQSHQMPRSPPSFM